MPNSRKYFISLGIVVLALIISIIVGHYLNNWIGYLVVPFGIVAIEYCLQSVRYKTFYPPLVAWIGKRKPITTEAIEQPQNEPIKSNLITSIAVLKLKDFITCCVDNDLSVLGEGSEDERKEAFTDLLSQYYEAKGDTEIKEYLQVVSQIKAIELHRELINTIAMVMRERYSQAGAEALRNLYKQFGYQFTEESLEEDLEKVRRGEISNDVTYKRLLKDLEKLDKAKTKSKDLTHVQKLSNFRQRIFDINKVEHGSYDDQMSVLDFAILEARLIEHIETLKDQANGR